ncbi:hypothetical protein FQR65_LT17006, partial [Abscondita terminalis]
GTYVEETCNKTNSETSPTNRTPSSLENMMSYNGESLLVDSTNHVAEVASSIPVRPELYTQVKSNENINLRAILQNYAEGRLILKCVDNGEREVPEAYRQILVDKIVDFFVQNEQKLNVNAAETISNQIKTLYPDEIKEYYYVPQPGKAAKGKLLAKYYNQIRKLKAVGLVENKICRKKSGQSSKHISPSPMAEENSEIAKETLRFVQEGERWEEVQKLWVSCQNLRRAMLLQSNTGNVAEFIKEWPAFGRPLGYTL